MDLSSPFRLEQREYAVPELRARHPPRLVNGSKQLVDRLVADRVGAGVLGYSRWRARPLPVVVPTAALRLDLRPTVYDYREGGPATWHVNFADPHLFVAYGSALLAQDELQALAARLAGVERLVFHAVNHSGVDDVEAGLEALARVLARGPLETDSVLERLAARGDVWGTSNGT